MPIQEQLQWQEQGYPGLSQDGQEQPGLTAAALPLHVLPLLPQQLNRVTGNKAQHCPMHSRNDSHGGAPQPFSTSCSSRSRSPTLGLQGALHSTCSSNPQPLSSGSTGSGPGSSLQGAQQNTCCSTPQPLSSGSTGSGPDTGLQGGPQDNSSCPSYSHATTPTSARGREGGDSVNGTCIGIRPDAHHEVDGGYAAAAADGRPHNQGGTAGPADWRDCHRVRGTQLEGLSNSSSSSSNSSSVNGSGGGASDGMGSGKENYSRGHAARRGEGLNLAKGQGPMRPCSSSRSAERGPDFQCGPVAAAPGQGKSLNLAKGLGLMRSCSSSLNLTKDGTCEASGDAAMFRLCQQQQRSILRTPKSSTSLSAWQSQEPSPSGQASCTLSMMRSQDLNPLADAADGTAQAGPEAGHDAHRLANVAKADHTAPAVSAAMKQQQQQQQQQQVSAKELPPESGLTEISNSSSSSQQTELLNQGQQQQQQQQQQQRQHQQQQGGILPVLQQLQGCEAHNQGLQVPLSPLKFFKVSSQDLRHQVQQFRGQTKSALATALQTQVGDSPPAGQQPPPGWVSSADQFPFILHLPDAHNSPHLHHMHLKAHGADVQKTAKWRAAYFFAPTWLALEESHLKD
ncbi:hypothetical protein DUNSADRAFT_15335 [Dunaliella salina]|uniref:Uncharacterized protein n=1 Tax=Dunaliella salina TaxID=3046 RepID=A0ABQ7G5K3_DUNSA|nr:hypothetical protein DUNSADRAFT_15335 [Dunaliella salina]|eukprot:KAF5829892.1 hypothetical protein DUNSADRAFT_15335 [Dunaliella salina]